jgi:cholest-4-en-3-one 26-monooxygenase
MYAERLPIDELAHMRKVAQIWWQEQERGNLAFGDTGYWVVTKHKDVKEVSRRSDVFSSNRKTALPRYRDEAEPESLEAGKVVLLNQDLNTPPAQDHLARVHPRHRVAADELASGPTTRWGGRGEDRAISPSRCRASFRAGIAELDRPQADCKKLFDWSNQMVGDQDPEYARNDPTAASASGRVRHADGGGAGQEPRHDLVPVGRPTSRALTDDNWLLRHPVGGRGNETTATRSRRA